MRMRKFKSFVWNFFLQIRDCEKKFGEIQELFKVIMDGMTLGGL